MTVYVVIWHDFEDDEIQGVFASREDAEEFAQGALLKWDVEEWEVQ